MNNPRVISFERWLKENEVFVRNQQESCIIGHAESGDRWWDTHVDIECYGCGRRPGQDKTSWQLCCDCEDLDDYPPCDCNAKVLYEKAVEEVFASLNRKKS